MDFFDQKFVINSIWLSLSRDSRVGFLFGRVGYNGTFTKGKYNTSMTLHIRIATQKTKNLISLLDNHVFSMNCPNMSSFFTSIFLFTPCVEYVTRLGIFIAWLDIINMPGDGMLLSSTILFATQMSYWWHILIVGGSEENFCQQGRYERYEKRERY